MVLGFLKSRARLVAMLLVLLGVFCLMPSMAHAQATPEHKGTSALVVVFTIMDVLVVLILASCSIAGIALIIDGFLHVKESRIAPVETTEHLRSLIGSRQFKELMDFTTTDQSFVSQSVNAGLRRAHLGYPAMREALESAAGEQTANIFRRIEFLNIIGNIGPLIGLLGTVLGMIIAFYSMEAAGGNPKPSELAGGIARALWHTFGGLFVAIPSLLVFGYLRTKADKISTTASLVSEELLESLRPTEKGGAVAGGSEAAPAPAKPSPRRAAPAPAPSAE